VGLFPFLGPPSSVRGGAVRAVRAVTVTTTTAAAAAVMAVPTPPPVLNLQRTGYLLQEMSTYATLAALVLNSALRLWTSTKFHKDQGALVGHLFTVSTALCVVAGVFTALLFQLLDIYSKSALGMVNDNGYLAFTAATAVYRKWGFRCFLAETSAFVVSFLLNLYNTLWENVRVLDPPPANPPSQQLGNAVPDDDEEEAGTTTTATNKDKGGGLLGRVLHLLGGGGGGAPPGPLRRVGTCIMIGAIALTAVGAYHIKHVLDIATRFIFVEAFSDKFA
jgi:hypothetical protein